VWRCVLRNHVASSQLAAWSLAAIGVLDGDSQWGTGTTCGLQSGAWNQKKWSQMGLASARGSDIEAGAGL
jgi:hypothetical protein